MKVKKTVVIAGVVIALLGATPAEAHSRKKSRGHRRAVLTLQNFEGDHRDKVLACIRYWESNGNYSDDGAPYWGAYQVNKGKMNSWWPGRSIHQVSKEEQDSRAWTLYEIRGLRPWSREARRYCR